MGTATKNKTNERPGTRAQVRYVRMSASKVRVVLNLIRGKHVVEAAEILSFSERLAAQVIGKALRSAVANAVNNDEIPTEELFVSACYADEGPTLKRFRPRARGRAGRIHKQTCHITIVVSRYSDEDLDLRRRQAELRGESSGRSTDAAADRARRVASSRQAADDTVEETPVDAVEAEATEAVAAEAATESVATEVVDETTDVATDEAAASDEPQGDGADGKAAEPEETN